MKHPVYISYNAFCCWFFISVSHIYVRRTQKS